MKAKATRPGATILSTGHAEAKSGRPVAAVPHDVITRGEVDASLTSRANATRVRRARRLAAKVGCRIRNGRLVHVNTGRVICGPASLSEIETFLEAWTSDPDCAPGDYLLRLHPDTPAGISGLWDAVVATGDGHRLHHELQVVTASEEDARKRVAAIEETALGFDWIIFVTANLPARIDQQIVQAFTVIAGGWSRGSVHRGPGIQCPGATCVRVRRAQQERGGL